MSSDQLPVTNEAIDCTSDSTLRDGFHCTDSEARRELISFWHLFIMLGVLTASVSKSEGESATPSFPAVHLTFDTYVCMYALVYHCARCSASQGEAAGQGNQQLAETQAATAAWPSLQSTHATPALGCHGCQWVPYSPKLFARCHALASHGVVVVVVVACCAATACPCGCVCLCCVVSMVGCRAGE